MCLCVCMCVCVYVCVCVCVCVCISISCQVVLCPHVCSVCDVSRCALVLFSLMMMFKFLANTCTIISFEHPAVYNLCFHSYSKPYFLS